MESFNQQVNELHRAFCESSAFDMELIPQHEQAWLYVLSHTPFTPDDVRLVVKHRLKGIASGERKRASIYLRNLIGTVGDQDGPLAEFHQELADVRSKMRKPKYDSGKVTVLAATHRPTEPPQRDAVPARDVIRGLREAAQ